MTAPTIETEERTEERAAPAVSLRAALAGIVLLLTVGLLFCHGCHTGGHEDDDLSVFFEVQHRGDARR